MGWVTINNKTKKDATRPLGRIASFITL